MDEAGAPAGADARLVVAAGRRYDRAMALRVALVLSAVALVAALPAGAAKPLPGGVSNCLTKSVKVRPAGIVVACADDGFYLTGLKWAAWTQTAAHGTGTAHVNDCNPYCAAGHFHTYPVAVRLFKPATCKGAARARFTRLFYRFPHAKPAGPRTGTVPFNC